MTVQWSVCFWTTLPLPPNDFFPPSKGKGFVLRSTNGFLALSFKQIYLLKMDQMVMLGIEVTRWSCWEWSTVNQRRNTTFKNPRAQKKVLCLLTWLRWTNMLWKCWRESVRSAYGRDIMCCQGEFSKCSIWPSETVSACNDVGANKLPDCSSKTNLNTKDLLKLDIVANWWQVV